MVLQSPGHFVTAPFTQRGLLGEQMALFRELARLSMLEVSPIAIKYMLFKKRIFSTYEMRLPLTAASVETREIIDKIWNEGIQ